MVKEIVIISGKGGSGKTSITLALSNLFKNKIMVDSDVDASDMHLILNPNIKEKYDFYSGKKALIDESKCIKCGVCKSFCLFNAISEDIKINEYFCEGCGACKTKCPQNAITLEKQKSGDWFEAETRFGDLIYAKLGIAEENSGKLVSQIRTSAKINANNQKKDLIIVDGPPGIGCPVIASISGASLVLVIIEPSLSGLHDAKRVIELAKHFKVKAVACINKFDVNQQVCNEIEEFLQKNNVELLGKIPYSKDFANAMFENKTLIEYDENSEVSQEIKKIKLKLEGVLYE